MPEESLRNTAPLFFKRQWVLVIIIILLLFVLKHSFHLRGIGYDQIPETYVVLDERTWVWQGLSIRKSGIPAGWSQLQAYKKGYGGAIEGLNVIVDERKPTLKNFYNFPKPALAVLEFDYGRGTKHTPIVQPLIEQPPLGGLILSSLVSEKVQTFTDLAPSEFRKVSLWLGVVTGILIFILGWQVFNNPLIGLFGVAIFGTVPSFLLLSRYALLENVMTPFVVMAAIFLTLAKSLLPRVNLVLILAGVFVGLASLSKITGWVYLPMGIFMLLVWKFSSKKILLFTLPAIILGSAYFIWAIYLAPQLLLDIFRYQGLERGFIGSINLLVTVSGIGILNFPFDGWWMGGFLSLAFILPKKEYLAVSVPTVASLFVALFLGGANFPWYFIPMIPFMCLSIAYFIWQVLVNPSFVKVLVFFLVFFSSSFYWGYGVFKASLPSTNYQQPFELYRLFLVLFLMAGLILPSFLKYKIIKYLWFISVLGIGYQLFEWNTQSFLFILSHWGKLPSLYTPGTF